MAYEQSFIGAIESSGISLGVLLIIVLWTAFWKLFGLWKSARKGHTVWFILIALINTFGILPILYIFGFSDFNFKEKSNNQHSSK